MHQNHPAATPEPRDERQSGGARLDRSFQRRYSGLLVVLVAMVGLPLGVLLFRQVDEVLRLADAALRASGEASVAEKVALDRARALNRRLELETTRPGAVDRAQRARAQGASQAEADRIATRGKTLAAAGAQIRRQRAALADQRSTIRFTLALGLALLLALVAGFGVLVTHRVLQPIHWIRERIAAVTAGQGDAPEPLGPEHPLQSLQVDFQTMVDRLRNHPT